MYKLISSFSIALLMGCSTVSTTSYAVPPEGLSQRDLQSPAKTLAGAGFVTNEAKQLLEFCIELNNQDDRAKSNAAEFLAKPEGWEIVFDSRNPANHEWNKKLPKPVIGADPNNPETNGFGPFNNAWLLLKSTSDTNQYAIAIRGTVGEVDSIMADAFVTTVAARNGISLQDKVFPISFAVTPKAELHSGFAYAAFTLLFDKELGILKKLHDVGLPENAKLFITGHSQGAAIATLVHSFFYYALTDSNDRYQLKLHLKQGDSNGVQLKSYLFAQPKPGNLQYAEDFARITKDVSYTINNSLDPVPQVPLTIQLASEVTDGVADDNAGKSSVLDNLKFTDNTLKKLRADIAQRGTEHIKSRFETKKANLDLHYFDNDKSVNKIEAHSLNYTLAGQLIPVFGIDKGGDLYPIGNDKDVLLQHHATSYRKLMQQQIK